MSNYKHKYLKYKKKYLNLKQYGGYDIINDQNLTTFRENLKDIILLTGKGGVGKSTVANIFSDKLNYKIISMDDIIKKEIIPKLTKEINDELNNDTNKIYLLYKNNNDLPDVVKKAKIMFINIISNKIKKCLLNHEKVIVEGSLINSNVIDNIFGNKETFDIIVVKPPDFNTYLERILTRFKNEPESYGRIGWIQRIDTNQNLLNDYYQHGNNSQLITIIIPNEAKKQYYEIESYQDNYKYYNIYLYLN